VTPQPVAEGAAVIYLIVGVDRTTFGRWHRNVMAGDAPSAARLARARAAAQGIDLVVAAVVGPYASVVDYVDDAPVIRKAA
jgi:hypothetical protein